MRPKKRRVTAADSAAIRSSRASGAGASRRRKRPAKSVRRLDSNWDENGIEGERTHRVLHARRPSVEELRKFRHLDQKPLTSLFTSANFVCFSPPPQTHMKIPLKKLVLVGTFTLMAMAYSQAAVVLSLVDTGTGMSSLSIIPGQSFSLNVLVGGLTSPGLDNFDLQLVTLPAGVAFTSPTDTVPAGWINLLPNPVSNPTAYAEVLAARQYGASNFSGVDITGGATLVQLNFSTTGASAGNYPIDFIASTTFLRDFSNVSIPYTTSSPFSLTVVPEPGSVSLLLSVGCFLLIWRRRRHLRRHLASMN